MPENKSGRAAMLTGVVAAVLLAGLWAASRGPSWISGTTPLVVYCAHDAVFSEEVLKAFTRDTGIVVEPRFDTEATKSLGLVNLIQQEAQQPRCDVFWNNELLGMLDLQEYGLLDPYKGTGWQRMPEQFRDPDGHWVGFAARLRMWIVNTDELAAEPSEVEAVLQFEPHRAAFAQPIFGTTLTHYTVLWDRWGPERLMAWHDDLRKRGLREVPGNGLVKDLVAQGRCDVGATDTDDVFVAKDAGSPVDMLPIRVDGRTIAIPNSVGIIRGTRHRAAAEKLVDYLTSERTELALARSAARQIPLGPVDSAALPDEVRPLAEFAQQGVDLRNLLPARRAVLEWLAPESRR